MNRDFTFTTYEEIINTFLEMNYDIVTVDEYLSRKETFGKCLILRHDVDRFPLQTLRMSKLEAKLGVSSTYYFRIIDSVFKPKILNAVKMFGHEIGYHYEDLALCNGDVEKALKHFNDSLSRLRKYAAVRTICMHGSPLSKHDNKVMWQEANYKDFDIIGDTSYDINFNEVFYITDNGMGWNKRGVSVRDKYTTNYNIPIKDSFHLIQLLKQGVLPERIMLNAHPDTFFQKLIPWFLNVCFIRTKNFAKKALLIIKLIG